jgi:hypothetical protein
MVTVLHVIEQNSVTENKVTRLQQRNRIGLFNWMIRNGISVSHDGVESYIPTIQTFQINAWFVTIT